MGDRPEPLVTDATFRRLAALFLVLGSLFFGLALADRAASVLGFFSQIVLVCFLAWLLAFIISPLAGLIDDHTPLGRRQAIVVVYAGLAIVLLVSVWASATIGLDEANQLLGRTDEAIANIGKILAGVQVFFGISTGKVDLQAWFASNAHAVIPGLVANLSAQFTNIAAGVITVIGTILLILVLSVYMVSDSDNLQAKFRRVVPNRYATELGVINRSVTTSFGGFLQAQVFMMIIQAALIAIVGLAFGLPLIFICTMVGALAMVIPFFGPPLAIILPILVSLAFVPGVVIPVTVVLMGSQFILLNVVHPRMVRNSTAMHPILVLIALLVGTQVAGWWGAIFGIPVVAVLAILANYFINLRAVAEASSVELEAVTSDLRAQDPDILPETIAAIAADKAEAPPSPPKSQPRSPRTARS